MARKTIAPTTELGEHLEQEREDRALTKDAWCKELRVGRPTYDAWLTRPVDIEFINIRRIAVVVGVTVDTVFGWIEIDVPIIHAPSMARWFGRPIDIPAAA
jgi:hypothetical protein